MHVPIPREDSRRGYSNQEPGFARNGNLGRGLKPFPQPTPEIPVSEIDKSFRQCSHTKSFLCTEEFPHI